ncbi:MAG: Gfo/Idh/MocA family oxidoreductase [Verrucomicrobiota bacterium]|nr:Gfo/Idh/MocA family oxidoreductase [Verrucomicrobiota bacterium]MED6299143.1 Gfo/Idh/MocA family oxidoreductase [Verrucomicrobiota bacterium]
MITRIGLYGAGDIADLHAAGVQGCDSADLVGLFDIDKNRSQEKSLQYNCKSYDSAESMLSDPAIDAVFVLTPLEEHCECAVSALRSGKHVLLEKPVGSTINEIEEIKAAAQESGKLCVPVHNYLYEDSVIRTRELLDSGKLGDLVAIYVFYNIHHPEEVAQRYPGVIRQILTHHAYITCFLGGKPRKAMAMASTINDGTVDKENLAMAILELEGGALAHLQASFAADDHADDNWTFKIKLIGTAGSTRFSHADWVQNQKAVVHSHTYSAYHYSILNTVRYFIEECIERDRAPLSSLEDAITAQKIIEVIESSVREGKAIDL